MKLNSSILTFAKETKEKEFAKNLKLVLAMH